ncbi:hsp90 co-chaperone Cdc37-like [Gigantopelta aegis]|uniref:hsp90 co-chaperone Cdc37-like n=1 Tax=Gigantopelta aegis TaxID=1735272 RepID=UPI001B88B751|nr:hsp90 co-chaperone Cdc37-like [Gigantopelta aegis]
MSINYSKWDHIEVSDDEDDTHPNIDTGSLFRWRHQARVERMEQQKKKKEELLQAKQSYQTRKNDMKQKIKEAESKPADMEKLKIELSELELQEKEFLKKEEDLKKEEKLTPWNIDTICHEGMSRTIINKPKPAPKPETDEDKAEKQRTFTNKYKDQIKKYGMMRRYEDSQQYLTDNPHLVCDETCNYLVLWCVDLVIEEKKDLMEHVSHQVIVMQFILELAKSLERDPRSCVAAFFSRIKLGEKQYMDAFNDELTAFRERVETRAQARIDEAVREYEEEERKKRLGPGGLDPVEVLESLPDCLKACFESKDLELLKKTIVELPKEEAERHMKRCIDSGLWVPNAADLESDATTKDANGVEEEVYDEID